MSAFGEPVWLQAVRRLLTDPSSPMEREASAPWLSWLTLAVLRQALRQQFGFRLVLERLSEPDAEEGEVPSMPGWSYEFHGMHCCLVGPGHEVLEVLLESDGWTRIDPYFTARRILRLTAPELPEARVQALLPDQDLLAHTLGTLTAEGVLCGAGLYPTELSRRWWKELEAVASFDFEKNALSAMRAVGDWEGLAGAEEDGPAQKAFTDRSRWLEAQLSSKASVGAVRALSKVLSEKEYLDCIRRLLKNGQLDATLGAALEPLTTRRDAHLTTEVQILLRHAERGKTHPYPVFACLEYLLRGGSSVESVEQTLIQFGLETHVPGYLGNPFAAELALLALEFSPQHARALVAAALGSEVPVSRSKMAAVLSCIPEPWAEDLLLEALRRGKRENTAEIRAALRYKGLEAQRWVEAFEATHPAPDHSGIGYTWQEVNEANAAPLLEQERTQAEAFLSKVGRPLERPV